MKGKIIKYRYVWLAFVPFAILCAYMMRYACDLPVYDQWNFVSTLEKWYNGNLAFVDLWSQHNEHRILFPRLIMLALAWLTHWNIFYELGVNLFLGVGICAIIFWQIRKTEILFNKRSNLTYFIVSFFIFSLAQAENWLWGWQLAFFLNVFVVLLGIVFLSVPALTLRNFLGALAAGVIASYSSANGLLFWILGLFILGMHPMKNDTKIRWIIAWLLVATLIITSYLYGYQKTPLHPSLFFFIKNPLQFGEYFLANLGSPFTFGRYRQIVAVVAGFFGLTTFLILLYFSYRLVRKRQMVLMAIVPWLSLSVYSIFSSGLIAVGRVGLGVDQALSLRYVTISNLFWIGIFVLGMFLNIDFTKSSMGLEGAPGFWISILRNKIFRVICISAFILLQIEIAQFPYRWARMRADIYATVRSDFQNEYYDEILVKRYVCAADIHQQISFLAKHRLASFSGNGVLINKPGDNAPVTRALPK